MSCCLKSPHPIAAANGRRNQEAGVKKYEMDQSCVCHDMTHFIQVCDFPGAICVFALMHCRHNVFER
jgi:hypothetical protein